MRPDDKAFLSRAQRRHLEAKPDFWTMAAGFSRAYLAGTHMAVGVLARLAETTLHYGERASATLLDAAAGTERPENGGRERAADQALALYRDYVRELAALPGIAGMSYFDQLDRLRLQQQKRTPAGDGD